MDSLFSIVMLVVAVIFFGALLKRSIHHITRITDSLFEATKDCTAIVRVNAAMYKYQSLIEASKKLGDETLNEEELIKRLRGE